MVKVASKPGLRFDGRLGLAMLMGAVLGGIIVAFFGPALHPFFYADSVPDWAAVWTMRWNALLAIVALISLVAAYLAAIYARQNVDFFRHVERLKRTEKQMSRFEGALQAAYAAQVVSTKGMALRQLATAARARTINPDRDQMLDLINYVSGLVNLSEIGMLDEGFYFNRHGNAIVSIYVALRPLLDVMQEDGLLEYDDLRSFAVRAYRHMTRGRFPHVLLEEIKLNAEGDDLVVLSQP